MNRFRFLLMTIAIPASLISFAQISFGGTPLLIAAEKLGLPAAPEVKLPSVDAAALMAEDGTLLASGVKGPYRFGFNHAVDLSTENSGIWNTMNDGTRVWRVGIKCPEAFSINFVFGEYDVPEGARVFAYNTAGEVLGGFTAPSNPGHTELGVSLIAGDHITVEYDEPANVAHAGHLRITQVTHAYRDVLKSVKNLGDSGPCNNNVICPLGDDWRNEIRAVAMIVVGGNGYCTGSLLNNCSSDGTPYFLTANHCVSGQSVGTWTFRFNWDSPTCTPTANGPTNQTVSGATLLYNSAASDVALLQLNTTPPANDSVFYDGWDKSGIFPQNLTVIHHPSGDVKKISFDTLAPGQSVMNFGLGNAQCWHIFSYSSGTTEGGSSGSGLLDQNHRIVGQLYGGTASCGNNIDDYYGRFDISYPHLVSWLGTCGDAIDGFDPNYVPVALDGAIQSITGIDATYCNVNSISPSVVIKNSGTTVLTALHLSYNVDALAPATLDWSGSLNTGSTATVQLNTITGLTNGAHTFHVTCSAPNGGTDLNAANNSKNADFTVASPASTVMLNITLDNYGSETTWQMAAQGGAVLYHGGPYANGMDQTVIHEAMCLGDGCYTLTMFDASGDGICCAYGNGDYEVTNQWGTVLVNGNGTFTTQTSNDFCLTTTGILSHSAPNRIQLTPNPSNGEVTLTLPSSAHATNVYVHDAIGRVVFMRTITAGVTSTALDLEHLANGTYVMEATIDDQRNVFRLVIQQ